MANKLKKVFSNNKISYKGKIRFNNNNTAQDFNKALNAVFERGETIRVNGEAAMYWGIDSGAGVFPFNEYEDITNIIVAPSIEKRKVQIIVDEKNDSFTIDSYHLKDGFVIKTPNNFPFELVMLFNKSQQNVKLNFTPHIEKAISIGEALLNIKQVQALLDCFFIKDTNGADTDLKKLRKTLSDFQDLFDKLFFLEETFEVKFNIKDIDLKDNDSYKELFELCFSVREKKALRINGKMTASEGTGFNVQTETELELKEGEPLALTFMSEVSYTIWKKKFKLYCVFYLVNALLKDLIQLENGNTRIIYGEDEANPMYMAYKGYASEKEARDEIKCIMSHKEEYENAKTADQCWAEWT